QDVVAEKARNDPNYVKIDGQPELSQRIREKLMNPDLTIYKIENAAYKFSFMLVPISLPFIAFLFLFKKGLTLYDHTVYALYSLSFASLVFVAVLVVGQSPWTKWAGAPLIWLGFPIHTFFHLKGAYSLKIWSALWRTFFMLTFASICLAIYIV